MRLTFAVALSLALPLGAANAASLHGEFSAEWSGEFHAGFGDHEKLGGGLFGAPIGWRNSAAVQSRFENKFADLADAYDLGVAQIEDFYSSDDYDHIVERMERLVDRYDWFVTGVERTIDRLGDAIASANDDVTFFDELLAAYQGRDQLSEKRLARVEDWIMTIQDGLQLKIDVFTEKQSDLAASLPTYQDFQSQLTTYYDEIVAAGGADTGEDDGANEATVIVSLQVRAAQGACTRCEAASVAGALAAPEPSPASLALFAGVASAVAGRIRRRPGAVIPVTSYHAARQ